VTAVYRAGSGVLLPGRPLGRGGEGEVFALADGSPRAIKIYASPDAAREAKVRSMAAAGLTGRCPGVAFPAEPAYAADGSFAGFVMPLVEDGHLIHELFSPGSRRREFPRADWRFLVRTAVNLARVIDRVHEAGAIVGDINGSGVLVSPRAVVSLIDADSFQWGSEHPCRVGVPEYTAPELQGRNLNGLIRTVQHDAFGLAVLVFQLMFLGRHPHAGVPKGRELPLIDAIGQNCFGYSRIQSVRLTPPRGTLLLTDLPLGLAALFERAFAGLGPRPLPREWVAELRDLEQAIIACDRKDGHYRSAAASDCPWCRIERSTRAPTFGSGAPSVPHERTSTNVDPVRTEVDRVLARARAEAGEGVRPPMPTKLPNPSVAATVVIERFGGVGRGEAGKSFMSDHRRAQRNLNGAIEAWRNRVGAWTGARGAADLAAAAAHHDTAAFDDEKVMDGLKRDLRARQIMDELRRLPLTAAVMPGLGERTVARLAGAGIKYAADISRDALKTVHGIGEKGIVALLLWRDVVTVEAERKTKADPQKIAVAFEDARARQLDEDTRRKRKLTRLAIELDTALDELAARARLPDRRLDAAIVAYQQALADLRHLGLPEHGEGARPAPVQLKSITKPGPPRRGGAGCPVCGSAMVKRWARSGSAPGSSFLGCSAYPACTGSRSLRSRKP